MERLLSTLGHSARLAIVRHLLGVDSELRRTRSATHAQLRQTLGINGGTLTKDLAKLMKAGLVVSEPGPRADQSVYALRRPEEILDVLRSAAQLDVGLAEDLALLYRIEAEVKADEARQLGAQSFSSSPS